MARSIGAGNIRRAIPVSGSLVLEEREKMSFNFFISYLIKLRINNVYLINKLFI